MNTQYLKQRVGAIIWFSGIILLIGAISGCTSISEISVAGKAEPIPSAASSARFQAMVFDVRIPDSRISGFDVRAINEKAGTALEFEKALRGLGETKVLYLVDQAVNLKQDAKIIVGSNVWQEAGKSVNAQGGVTSLSEKKDLGIAFSLRRPPDDAGSGTGHQLDLSLEVLDGGSIGSAPDRTVPRSRNVELSYSGITDSGSPCVMACIDASVKNKNNEAIAYVCRVVLSPDQ